MADASRKIVPPTVTKDNSQETNFMLAGYGSPATDNLMASKDEMAFPGGSEVKKSSGEAAVAKFRMPI